MLTRRQPEAPEHVEQLANREAGCRTLVDLHRAAGKEGGRHRTCGIRRSPFECTDATTWPSLLHLQPRAMA